MRQQKKPYLAKKLLHTSKSCVYNTRTLLDCRHICVGWLDSGVERLTQTPRVGKLVSEFPKPASLTARGLFHLASPMRFPSPLRSRDYGNPEDIVAARQAEAANKAKRDSEREANVLVAKRPVLTVRKGWAARKAIESLFARGAAVSGVQSPALPAMEVDPE